MTASNAKLIKRSRAIFPWTSTKLKHLAIDIAMAIQEHGEDTDIWTDDGNFSIAYESMETDAEVHWRIKHEVIMKKRDLIAMKKHMKQYPFEVAEFLSEQKEDSGYWPEG